MILNENHKYNPTAHDIIITELSNWPECITEGRERYKKIYKVTTPSNVIMGYVGESHVEKANECAFWYSDGQLNLAWEPTIFGVIYTGIIDAWEYIS